jgi:hypothetical protein
MACTLPGNYGLRKLMDQQMRYMRGGLTTWLRIKNFKDNPVYADMGFQFVPSASGAYVPTGTTDILIDPPPSVVLMGMHSLAMAQMSGVQLRAGARLVTLSHTWVANQMASRWFLNMCNTFGLDSKDHMLVFRGPIVLGMVTDKLLLELVDTTHEDLFGEPMTWFITANASELSNSAVPTL